MKKAIYILLALVGLFLLAPFCGSAQTIQYSASVPHTAGTPSGAPTTYGSWLRYDKTNYKLYFRNASAWGLASPYFGSGTIPTGTVGTLGGTFDISTGASGEFQAGRLSGGNGTKLYVSDLAGILGNSTYYVSTSPDNANSILVSPAGFYEATNVGLHIRLQSGGSSGFLVTDSRATPRGIQYSADYSAGFTSRSLVDKGYVDGAITAGADGNGLADGDQTIPANTDANLLGNFRIYDTGLGKSVFNYVSPDLSLGHSSGGVVIDAPEFSFQLSSGTATQIPGLTAAGLAVPVTLGPGLSLSGGALSATGGGGGAFTDLSDVPSSYSGQSGKIVAVNGAETGLEFVGSGGSSVLSGVKFLLHSDETASSEVTSSATESSAHKTYALAANSYTSIVIEAVVRMRIDQDASTKGDFTWNIKEGGSTVATFAPRIIALATTGADGGGRYINTISTVISGGQGSTTNLTITSQNSISNANTGAQVLAFRVYAIDDVSLVGVGLGDDWGTDVVETTAALTGDGTSGSPLGVATGGIGATEIASTAVTPGSYTNASITVDADGRLTAASSPYSVYTALISQAGTSDPTATVFTNTLGGTVVWDRPSSAGVYTATLAGAFAANKTVFLLTFQGQVGSEASAFMARTSSDVCELVVLDTSGTPTDDSTLFVEIRVYP